MESNASIAKSFEEKVRSDSTSDLTRKAKLLLTLKDVYPGSFYDDQKRDLLEQLLSANLSLPEAAVVLKSLLTAGFIDVNEVSLYTTRLLTGAPAPQRAPSTQAATTDAPSIPSHVDNKIKWNGVEIEPETKLVSIDAAIISKMGAETSSIKDLLALLNNLGVESIKDALELYKNHKKFNVLVDLMQEDQQELFEKTINLFIEERISFVTQDIELFSQQQSKQVESMQKQNEVQQTMYHIYNEQAQLLILPIESNYQYFCIIDKQEDEVSIEKKGEQLLFFLDISASMNHDEKGMYCAPKSPDHIASSIKKARNLILPLTMAALKRQASVTIIPWNYKIYPAIEFNPDSFIDKESGEFIKDQDMENEIKKQTSESVFVAKGGTNIEAALNEMSARIIQASSKVSNVSVWFLTDGEETVYLKEDGSPDRIPSNKADPKYNFFTMETEDGLTQYQKQLISILKKTHLDIADRKCDLELHVCHLGEAHPIFLKGMRDAVNGHFHAVKDVSSIEKEMSALATGTSSTITIIGNNTGKLYKLPAANSDAALVSRGLLPASLFLNDILVTMSAKVKLYSSEIYELNISDVTTLDPKIQKGIKDILSLEPKLDSLMKTLSNNITASKIDSATRSLNDLKTLRLETITSVARLVRSGTILQIFLEKVLESAESQMDALERLLLEYSTKEGKEYDKNSARSNDLFSERQKLAIEAGLESMRVHLGKGFVAQTFLDKKIQKMVASSGAWARKMLGRVCMVAETEKGEHTLLTLIIVEGEIQKTSRNSLVSKLASEQTDSNVLKLLKESTTTVKFTEVLKHDEKEQVISTVTIIIKGTNGREFKIIKTVPIKDIYSKTVVTYTCKPLTEDLEDSYKRMIDPLSFTNFIELIRENNTLPAYMYTIATNQSMGLLFNAKEQLYVISGGFESTSFDYFRLYWRLAKNRDNDTKEVLVPGTFHKANCAIPIAPDPLTNLVLSNLMPGLLSEFVTGTPMAPLTAIGNMYIGYLIMHMRNKPHSGIDVSRIGEILCTIACWIDNPNTLPKEEEFREIVDNMVKKQKVPPADSPGRNIPTKGFIYALLDDLHPLNEKFTALQRESIKRFLKQMLVIKLGSEQNAQLAKHQLVSRDFFKKLVTDLAQNEELIEGVPVHHIAMAEKLVNLANLQNDGACVEFLTEKNHFATVVTTLHNLFNTIGNQAMPQYVHWSSSTRFFYVWFAIGTFPIGKLKETFREYKSPALFEKHLQNLLDILKNQDINFSGTITSWITEEQAGLDFVILRMLPPDRIEIRSIRSNKIIQLEIKELSKHFDNILVRQGILHVWKLFSQLLNYWPGFWKGRKSNCFGLLDIDFEVLQALKDSTLQLVEKLNPTQLSEYQKAKEWKIEAYLPFVPPKPELAKLSDADHIEAKQEAVAMTGKPRVSIIIIGNVDSGKSTTCGHLIWKCGGIDKRTVDRLEQAAVNLGKASFKWAWIMDRLRTERERGVTIETAMWNIQLNNYDVDIIDAPGHKDFIKNMAVGSSLADAAILVVSAAPGEFENGISKGGTTREEAIVAFTNGIKQFIVIVNKMDVVQYSQSRFDEIKSNIMQVLVKMGVSKDICPVVPVSSWTGDNLLQPSDKMPWFKGWNVTLRDRGEITGVTLIDALNAIQVPRRAVEMPLRIPILNVYKIGGVGTVAVGRVACGVLKKGDTVVVMPNNLQGTTNSIEIYHSDRSEVMAGDVIGFNIKNCSVTDVHRGMVACLPDKPLAPVIRFTVQLVILNHPNEIRSGYTPVFYVHTSNFPAKFVELTAKVDKRTGAVTEEKPKGIKQGEAALVVVEAQKPVCVEPFKDCPPLGRFAIRDNGVTVAVGVVKSVEKMIVAKPNKTQPKNKSKYFR